MTDRHVLQASRMLTNLSKWGEKLQTYEKRTHIPGILGRCLLS
jgi:hypothetical protein